MRYRDGQKIWESVDDGGDGGGAGGDQSGGGTPGGDVSDEVGKAAGEVSGIPAGLPEKFWDANTNTVRQDDLIGAYNNISSSYTKKQEDIRASMDQERLSARPADAEGYKFEMPENFQTPDGYEVTLNDQDPMLQFWKEHAFENGYGQEQFDKGIEMYLNSQVSALPDRAAEIAALGERGDERYSRVAAWLTKDMPEDSHSAIAELIKTSDGVIAAERLMERGGASFTQRDVSTAVAAEDNPANEASFRAKTINLMAEHGPGTYGGGDPGAVQIVRDRWKKLDPTTTEPQRNRSG